MSISTTLSRRALVAGATATSIALPFGSRVAAQSDAPLVDGILDPAMLEPATTPATWEIEKTYNPATVEPIAPTNYCDLQIYPVVPNAQLAYSGVLMAEDLASVPNLVLVQHYQYATDADAAADFEHVRAETYMLARSKFTADGGDDLVAVTHAADETLDIHHAGNGTGYALLNRQQGREILTIRAAAAQQDPPIEVVRMLADRILQTELQATALPAYDVDDMSDLPAVELAQYQTQWSLPGWTWNYGPLDIHPDRYVSPVCVVPE